MKNFEKWLKGQLITSYGIKGKLSPSLNNLTIGTVVKLNLEEGFIFPVSNGQVDIELEQI